MSRKNNRAKHRRQHQLALDDEARYEQIRAKKALNRATARNDTEAIKKQSKILNKKPKVAPVVGSSVK
jgi:hypothetical protein